MNTSLSVHSLHALAYCERLFFLEEVERIRVADERVYAGRTLHVGIEREEDEEVLSLGLQSQKYGLIGKVDCIRRRDGQIIPYEHKRGRSAHDSEGKPSAWASDRLQIIAYSLLVEEHSEREVKEGRVRYHADNKTVCVPIDEEAREFFMASVKRAKDLQRSVERPPIAENERLCVKCSLAPVCLPEEARLAERLGKQIGKQPPLPEARHPSFESIGARQKPAREQGGSRIANSFEPKVSEESFESRGARQKPAREQGCKRIADSFEPGKVSEESFESRGARQNPARGQRRDRIADSFELSKVSEESLPAPNNAGRQDPAREVGHKSIATRAVKGTRKPLRLFPAEDKRQALHVLTNGAKVGRSGDRFKVWSPDKEEKDKFYPSQEVGQVILHGFSQISTQALRLCAYKNIGVHWVSYGGKYMGAWASGSGSVQRRIRQYKALTNRDFCLKLAKRLVDAKVRGQLSFILRASRENGREIKDVEEAISNIRKLFSSLSRSDDSDSLRGYEGSIGASYFRCMPHLISKDVDDEMRPNGRNRRPPTDRCNALLSYGYALLLKDVTNAIVTVGLDPCLGFYHTPRSQAQPLALDLMELFRVILVDIPIIGSINRRQWNIDEDFTIAGKQVWLSKEGRKKFIEIYERRKNDKWKHPVIGYSLSYARHLELEVRLLEKEWTDKLSSSAAKAEPSGLFAKMRLR